MPVYGIRYFGKKPDAYQVPERLCLWATEKSALSAMEKLNAGKIRPDNYGWTNPMEKVHGPFWAVVEDPAPTSNEWGEIAP